MSAARPLYDISRPLGPATEVWPGDAPFETSWTMRIRAGDPVNLAVARLSLHTGTHADAPFHADDAGADIGSLSLDPFVGPADLHDVPNHRPIGEGLLAEILVRRPGVERLLLRSGAWSGGPAFPRRFTYLEPDAAILLASSGIRLIGTDAPSVDPFDSTALPSHRILARAGIAILENLALDAVPEGSYELIALPLRLLGADGSPVRAVLRAP
jgi:arylformamidase